MTDFRRLCLEAEEKSVNTAEPVEKDDNVKSDSLADDIKRLEAEYGPLTEGKTITVQLQDLLAICPRSRRRIDAFKGLVKELAQRDVTLLIKSRKTK